MTKEEFDSLEPAGLVIVNQRMASHVATVVRKTATRVFVKLGSTELAYNHHGRGVGCGRWDTDFLTIPKDGQVDAVRNENRRKLSSIKLSNIDWSVFSLETLVRVLDIIEPELAKQGDAK